ncbi:UV-damaged DNA-binding protein rad7 [Exophiala xenobiotica]|nr:UV-damaged DNA-binding protein rad7 [Exophiala xenobiotica]
MTPLPNRFTAWTTTANRRGAAANRIRGPQSALTDFLASHNISAQQIQQDYQRRVEEAERQAQAAAAAATADNDKENQDEYEDGEDDPVERQKRKRKEEKALLKIKQSKEFKRRKHEKGSDYEEDDDELARSMLAKSRPLPGQLDNCEICEKRFTVTPYSGTGPDGGLLCGKCTKELKDEEKKEAKARKKKTPAPRGRRRQTESDRMMGDVKPGAKSLVEICVRRVANVVHDIDEFGDMPQNLLDRLSQILSKQRVITPRIFELFLRQDVDRIHVYDCGKLEKEDFQKMFAYMPNLETVNLRFAGQMKDDVALYMADKCKKIRHLQLGATNLVSDSVWVQLFRSLGPQLESLKLSELNDSMGDDTVKELVKNCQTLRRLKLRSCSHMTPDSLEALCNLSKLEHLTLAVAQDTPADILVKLVSSLGPNLRTLCLEDYIELDDTVLDAIKNHCHKLSKLRIRGSSLCSDTAFVGLFDNNSPFPPLVYADFAENRDIDSMNPEGPQDNPIGFGSLALTALMNHSSSRLKSLDLKSCRHISHMALLDAFDGLKKYPAITDMDLSFVTQVDEVVLVGIFKSCPALAKLVVFACFNARRAVIPTGIAVIGLPNAQDNIVREGDVQMEL